MAKLAKNYQSHPFHLVDPSPWPLITSFAAFSLTSGGVLYMQGYIGGFFAMAFGFVVLVSAMAVWWRDVIRESTFEGNHTSVVQLGIRYGMILFILSEVMFFFAFFWGFFHSSIAPTPDIGSVWPPKGIDVFDAFGVPALNTLILLTSGASCTWAHHAILAGRRKDAITGLTLTIGLAALFTSLQGYEYVTAPFGISDSIYGSCFYMATGFHGFHV